MNLFSKLFRSRDKPKDYLSVHWPFLFGGTAAGRNVNERTSMQHGRHPVLRWMMDNIFIKTDPAGNIKPDKEKSTEKIDGVVATIMALDRAIRCGLNNGESVYDERGILLL